MLSTISLLAEVAVLTTTNAQSNSLEDVDWPSIDLQSQISDTFKVESNGYRDNGVVSGFDSVGFEVRTYDGTGNNIQNPGYAATFAQTRRCVSSAYADGIAEPTGQNRMGPREISNLISRQFPEESDEFVNGRSLTQFAWQWGQFLDHDTTLISEATDEEIGVLSAEHIDISIPCDDPTFQCSAGEDGRFELFRTHAFPGTGAGFGVQREQQNELTAFLDASMIYGSDELRANNLRSMKEGKLLLNDDDLFGFLPNNGFVEENEPSSESAYKLAGDVRPNEFLGLFTMHTIWARFHNILAEEVADSLGDSSDDEAIYQFTKLIVNAIVQKITFEDWLPTLFGRTAVDRFVGRYSGYDETVDSGVCLIYSDAAFRFGHTMLPNFVPLRNEDCSFWTDFERDNCLDCDLTLGGIELRNAFFAPQIADNNPGFFEAVVNGYSCTLANEVDTFVTEGVRDFLFESAVFPLGSGSENDRLFGNLDLMSINIQRAREHGLPDYNTIRGELGLGRYSDFSQITSDSSLCSKLKQATNGDVNELDLIVALWAEDSLPDSTFGETHAAIVLGQYQRFRDGDRFFYQNYIKDGDLMKFIESMTLKDVIEIATEVYELQIDGDNIFQNEDAVPIFAASSGSSGSSDSDSSD